jgi:HAD superfamily hydrolase (TIGR01490 family)
MAHAVLAAAERAIASAAPAKRPPGSRPSPRPRTGPRVIASSSGWAATESSPAPGGPADPTAAAFFDVDNTMMRGASIYYLARGLAARRYLSSGDLARFAWKQLRFRLLAVEHGGHISSVKTTALAFIEGWDVDDMARQTKEIFDELMADRIWSGTHALARLHLDAGQRVWLVTAAPVELGRTIADRLGLTGALGTVAEVQHGRYTGNLVGDLLHGPAKAAAIRDLAAAEGLDLERCSAYSDSYNDTPMLSLVGHAVAVNPDASLRRAARARGWEIRDFRTGRKAAKVAVPAALATGAVVGATLLGLAVQRRRRSHR